MRRRGLVWRSIVVGAYVAWALVCSFVFGGGLGVLALFCAWAGAWLAFSLFWRWAEGTRSVLLRRRGYY